MLHGVIFGDPSRRTPPTYGPTMLLNGYEVAELDKRPARSYTTVRCLQGHLPVQDPESRGSGTDGRTASKAGIRGELMWQSCEPSRTPQMTRKDKVSG